MPHNVTLTDRDRRLYEEEFGGWVPDKILDAHVHVFPRTSFPADYEFEPKSCCRKFGCQHTAEQCMDIAQHLLPDTVFSMLTFGTPDLEADRERTAKYSGEIADNERVFSLALVSPEDAAPLLRRRLRDYGLLGYKPYRNLVRGKDPEAVSIPDMLPDGQMELADELGLIVTLHIPRSARLADPDNQREMVELVERFPNARIIFAHIGRAYFMKNVVGHLDGISEYPNAYLDMAMVNHPGVLEYTFNHFPRERILFGSDAPIAWLRGKSVEVNDQYAYLMGEDYRIGTAVYDVDHAVEFTFFFYEMLRGIKGAAEKAGLSRSELAAFFYGNAYTLLKDAAVRLHGA